MKRFSLLSIALFTVVPSHVASAHCEVPCGVYGDQRRFEEMLEDQTTIAKAFSSMAELGQQLEEGPDPQVVNQLVRWVSTKGQHATNTQHIIAQYFMTQRIKPGSDGYTEKLKAAHAVMVAAMKCKQTAAVKSAGVLKKAIFDLYRAYEGKEPKFE